MTYKQWNSQNRKWNIKTNNTTNEFVNTVLNEIMSIKNSDVIYRNDKGERKYKIDYLCSTLDKALRSNNSLMIDIKDGDTDKNFKTGFYGHYPIKTVDTNEKVGMIEIGTQYDGELGVNLYDEHNVNLNAYVGFRENDTSIVTPKNSDLEINI